MSTADISNSQFNTQRLKYWKNKRRQKSFLKGFFLILLLSVLCFGVYSYFIRLPYERHAFDASSFEKFKLGAKKFFNAAWLTITADQEDPNTKLPIAEIYIKGSRQDELNSDLPASGRIEQKAKFKYQNKSYDVDVRYRGDSLNHWAFPQKSWRVIMRKRDDYDGMTEINLNVPRVESQISNWLGYHMANDFDKLLVPDAELVHFRLNRQYDGVRLLLEQPNQEFVERRNLPFGKIYTGDINTEQIYGDVPRKRLYVDSLAWEVTSNTSDDSKREMGDLLRIVGQVHNPYEFYYQIRKHVDVDAMLQYMALLEIVGSVHVDATHNGKYYFNSYSGKFSPIVWDTVAYFWKNTMGFDLAPNELFRVLLYNPGLREKKDQYIYELINGRLNLEDLLKLVNETKWLVNTDVRAFALKLHANDKGIKHLSNAEWEKAVEELKETIIARHTAISQRLGLNDTHYRMKATNEPNKFLLAISTQAAAGAIIEELKIDSGIPFQIKRKGLDDLLKPVHAPENVRDHLFSKRKYVKGEGFRILPGVYIYEVNFAEIPVGVPDITLKLKNALSGKIFDAQYDESIIVPKEYAVNSVWWNPEDFVRGEKLEFSGEKILKEDLIIDQYSELNILPGTTLKLAEGVSVIADGGEINFLGTAENPIKVQALDNTWGVIAGINNAELNLEYVSFQGGSSEFYNNIRLDSELSLHYAKANIEHCHFDSYFVSRYSEVNLNNSVFNSIFKYPLVIENSVFEENDNEYLTIPAVHSPELVNQEAYGTSGRWEREYKYTFTNFNSEKHDSLSIAEGVRKALEETSKDRTYWSVSKYVPNDFYADKQAEEFLYSDIYFDTPSRLNHKFEVSYRYRNRYKNQKTYSYHNKDYYRSRFWPYRLEFQAKTNREELGGGFSKTLESRFEFRKESSPFSEHNIPPYAPWDRDIFIPYFQSGVFNGMPTESAKSVMQFYQDKIANKEELYFEPVFVLMTDRYRQHLNIKTPWGSGPNPEQAYIITLDHSKAYKAEEYLRFLDTRKLGNKKYPEPLPDMEIVELEVEFERNVSDVLDKEIEKSEDSEQLKKVREAFLADQEKIMKLVSEYFAKSNLVVKPIGKSKYVQVMDVLEGEVK